MDNHDSLHLLCCCERCYSELFHLNRTELEPRTDHSCRMYYSEHRLNCSNIHSTHLIYCYKPSYSRSYYSAMELDGRRNRIRLRMMNLLWFRYCGIDLNPPRYQVHIPRARFRVYQKTRFRRTYSS